MRQPTSAAEPTPTMTVETEAHVAGMVARIVRFDIPAPTARPIAAGDGYHINLCLTPRPLNARGCFRAHWGPHRYERLGDIFLLPPGEELFVRGGSGRQASLLCELATPAIATIFGEDLDWSAQHLASLLDITGASMRALLFRIAGELRHPGIASMQMLEFMAGELAIELGRTCLEVRERLTSGGLAGWRLRLIDERIEATGDVPTLAELASLTGLSVRQLTRGFRVSRGCSIGDYLEGRRMEAAKRLLMAGDSVKAVAFAMGFATPSSFTFAFRRAVGSSPSLFRQRQLRGATSD
jgi:AraC family transcriptional regulator